jgi:secretory lipase
MSQRGPWIAAILALLAVAGSGLFAYWALHPTKRRSTSALPTTSAAPAPGPTGASDEPQPSCAEDGCLRSVSKIGDYDRPTIERTLTPGVHVDNGYSVYTIAFATGGAEARATVAVPYGVAAPVGGWHVVANAHGTTGLDDPCAVAGTIAGAGLGGTFGARGLVGVAVDYPGLGTAGIHPYLVADSEGHAVLDALRATDHFARSSAIPLSRRFAVAGLSQGGHAVLAAAARHRAYARDLDIRAFAAVAPASVFEEHWRATVGVAGAHIPVHAMLVYAWADHYGYRGPSLWTPAVAPMVDAAMHECCMFSAVGAPPLGGRLGTSPQAIFSTELLAAYQSGDWGPFGLFEDAFAKNRIGPYAQTAPLKIYQGDADVIVPEWATHQLVEALRAGNVALDYEVVPGGTHTNVAFGAVAYPELRTDASIAWLRSRLDAR